MPIKDMQELILLATRPIHIFGDIEEKELNKKYRQLSKLVHPDNYINTEYIDLANKLFIKLHEFYEQAQKEYKTNTYNVFDILKIYEQSTPLFEFCIGKNDYRFYEHFCEGEVANIYKGICGKELIYLKVALDKQDNELIEKEYELLKKLTHKSLPIVLTNLKINELSAFIMNEVKGITAEELLEHFKNGVPAEHVMWILERLLGTLGYLHSNYIVHGNIKPEHIIINPETHNVTLVGFSMAITEANKSKSKYKVKDDYYSAPEIDNTSKVLPSSDIYSVGKVVIKLLGGDIKSNGMPIYINKNIREFIRKLVEKNPNIRENDAWKLWDELIVLRNEEYGMERFKELNLRRKK